jgi:ABC-type uncharacterized transport system substrate-binding protein
LGHEHRFRDVRDYVGRILNREKPADLPVVLVINLKAAKALGLELPSPCSRSPTR